MKFGRIEWLEMRSETVRDGRNAKQEVILAKEKKKYKDSINGNGWFS